MPALSHLIHIRATSIAPGHSPNEPGNSTSRSLARTQPDNSDTQNVEGFVARYLSGEEVAGAERSDLVALVSAGATGWLE